MSYLHIFIHLSYYHNQVYIWSTPTSLSAYYSFVFLPFHQVSAFKILSLISLSSEIKTPNWINLIRCADYLTKQQRKAVRGPTHIMLSNFLLPGLRIPLVNPFSPIILLYSQLCMKLDELILLQDSYSTKKKKGKGRRIRIRKSYFLNWDCTSESSIEGYNNYSTFIKHGKGKNLPNPQTFTRTRKARNLWKIKTYQKN